MLMPSSPWERKARDASRTMRSRMAGLWSAAYRMMTIILCGSRRQRNLAVRELAPHPLRGPKAESREPPHAHRHLARIQHERGDQHPRVAATPIEAEAIAV